MRLIKRIKLKFNFDGNTMNNKEIIPEIPPALQGSYRLSEDAIRAVQELVHSTMKLSINNMDLDEKVLKKYQEQLDKYMMKQYPDLSNRLNQLALDLKDKINKLEELAANLKLREKNVAKSDSLYEDVYAMRDEFKEIKKYLEAFDKKMKKVFGGKD